MEKIFDLVKESRLFQGIAHGDFEKMLDCLSARTRSYRKNDVILLAGDMVSFVGMILVGGVDVVREDIDGHAVILTKYIAPELFGEVFACAGIEHSPVTIRASEDSRLLTMNYRKIITSCSQACPFHARLIENMLSLLAQKYLMLSQKLDIISERTTREKLLSFLDAQRGSEKKFTMPYNREEMAHYLCVDRSALSKELGRMRDEGLIRFKRGEFEILGGVSE